MIGKPKKVDASAKEAVKKEAPKKEAAKKDSAKKIDAAPPTERDYATIIRPVVTEKATHVSANSQVVFQVPLAATKPEIRAAVQSLFKVKVLDVNTTTRKGKNKVFRGRVSRRGDVKLAYVTLEEGQSIDVAAGI